MTDTPRTLAQIQALLADNTSGDISPQDLRDMVMSVADPVAGGGFVERSSDTTPATSAAWAQSFSQSVLHNTFTAVSPGTPSPIHDPAGYLQAGTYVSSWYGITFQPYAWAVLPPGLYLCGTEQNWEANSTGLRSVYWDYADSYSGTDALQAVRAGATFIRAAVTPADIAFGAGNCTSFVYVPSGTTRRIGLVAIQNSGVTLNLTLVAQSIYRIGV